jgi:DNA-binding IscR family transcriptional regulator
MRMTRCSGEADKPCMPGRRCLTHGLWDALGDQIAAFLDSVTLQEVVDGIPPGKRAPRAAGTQLGIGTE